MYQEVTGDKFVPSAPSNIGMKLLIKGWKERNPIATINRANMVFIKWTFN